MIIENVQEELFNILCDITEVCEKNNIEYWLESGTLLGAVRHKGFIPWDDDIDIGMNRENYIRFLEVAPKKLKSKYMIQTIFNDVDYLTPHVPCKVRNIETRIFEDNYDKEINEKGLYIDIFPFDYVSDKKIIRTYNNLTKCIVSAKMLSNAKIKSPYLSKRNLKKNVIKFVCRIFKLCPLGFNKMILKNLQINKKTEFITYGYDTCFFNKFERNTIYPLKKIEFNNRLFYVPNDYDLYLKNLYGEYMTLPPEEERGSHISFFEYKNQK
ncbi:LicD family protein [Clostridium chrysemydis]|uniref:LicD family protein n=1 Tax=Clostridium chrysemydis TaxID=2665504 RepID=UPI003F414C6E